MISSPLFSLSEQHKRMTFTLTMAADLQFDVSNTVTSRYWGRNGSQADACVLIAGVVFSINRAHC